MTLRTASSKPSALGPSEIHQPVPWLNGLSPAVFMSQYWQKKPLLIRQGFPDFKPAISIETVLGLACQDDAESRLIRQKPKTGAWSLAHGPFAAEELPTLRSSNWTVLVQHVNGFLPAADEFLDAFRFLPQVRLDDLMISVAGQGGGVGAHIDSYDVFLVQA